MNIAIIAQALGEALDKMVKEQQITNNHLSVIREQNYLLLKLLSEEAPIEENANPDTPINGEH